MNRYTIRRSTMSDWDIIESVYKDGREKMIEAGNPSQWGNGYPRKEVIINDIEQKRHYVIEDVLGIAGCFTLLDKPEPSYAIIEGCWLNEKPYVTIHRLASRRGRHGIFKAVMHYLSTYYDEIRADTHKDNTIMQYLLAKMGFQYCGNIILVDREGSGTNQQPPFDSYSKAFRLGYQWSKKL